MFKKNKQTKTTKTATNPSINVHTFWYLLILHIHHRENLLKSFVTTTCFIPQARTGNCVSQTNAAKHHGEDSGGKNEGE